MNKYGKSMMSVLVITLLLIPILPIVTLSFGVPPGADSSDWYKTVEGVAHDDTYTLYPYFWDFTEKPKDRLFEPSSIQIGFSKFGEMINSYDNIGLQYTVDDTEEGRDPFAPPWDGEWYNSMPKDVWQEGWLINITYKSTVTGEMRNVWATAQHSDLVDWGNDWIRVDNDYPVGPDDEDEETPQDAGYYIGSDPALYGNGGRKTNGTAITEPMQVLYNGPR
ncbi:MAG: hypothetical protein H3Z50_07125, partial [archaeon]|nr:hypothetical protein [archaeon]